MSGLALIIVNQTFENSDNFRRGVDGDFLKMLALFKALDFDVQAFMDLTADEMKASVDRACAYFNDRKPKYFVLVISSHGEEVTEKTARSPATDPAVWKHYILGSDEKKIGLDDIFERFKQSENLKDIPKLLFIQACRVRQSKSVEAHDRGQEIEVLQPEHYVSQPQDAWFETDHTLLNLVLAYEGPHPDWVNAIYPEGANRPQTRRTDDRQSRTSEDDTASTETDAKAMQEEPSVHGQLPSLPQPTISPSTPVVGPVTQTGVEEGMGDPGSSGQTRQSQVSSGQPGAVSLPNLPDKCLIVYPAMGGRYSYRHNKVGSLLFHSMYKPEHVRMLLRGENLLHYLTSVAGDMANLDIKYRDDVFKANICIQHTLCHRVVFMEKDPNSLMAKIKSKLGH